MSGGKTATIFREREIDKFDPDPKFTDGACAQIERFLKARGYLPNT